MRPLFFLLALCTAALAERPNIIVFLVDDYDKPETSCYGGKVLTPNLDRLAREGMTFHQTHVSSTVCTPSRYSFLTGRYAGSSHSKVYREECPPGTQGAPGFNVSLEADNMNVGRVLRDAGYATGYVGKFHVGHDSGHHGLEKNVPFTEALNRKKFALEKEERELVKQHGFTWAKNIYWENIKAPFGAHNPDWTIAAALEFVEANQNQPFYLHYCTTLLHGPNGSWARSLDEPLVTGEGKIDKPVGLIDRKQILKRIDAAGLTRDEIGYLWMDATLGLLLDKLDALKLAENTIVLFVADHGSNRKGSLFTRRGTEIPCLARWPKVIPHGSETKALVSNIDFVPPRVSLLRAGSGARRQDGRLELPLPPLHRSATNRTQPPRRPLGEKVPRTQRWYLACRRRASARLRPGPALPSRNRSGRAGECRGEKSRGG